MTSEISRARERGFLRLLSAAAPIAALAGAVGSVGLVLYAGRNNKSLILMIVFALWVLAPFAAVLLANVVSKRWSALTRATLHGSMLLLMLGTLAIYVVVALRPPRPQGAFAFVMVPPASSLLVAIAISVAALVSGRRSRRDDGA